MKFYRALIMVSPHSEYIAQGLKTLTVRTWNKPDILNKTLLLIAGKLAFGYIKLTKISEIHNITEFKKLYRYHRITLDERKEWWHKNKILYAYQIHVIKIFNQLWSII